MIRCNIWVDYVVYGGILGLPAVAFIQCYVDVNIDIYFVIV